MKCAGSGQAPKSKAAAASSASASSARTGQTPGQPLCLTLLDDYLELVDATGRVIREDKRGFIPGQTPRLLERLALDPDQFIATAGRMMRQFGSAIGTPTHITDLCVARQTRYLRGMGAARALFEKQTA